MSVPTVFLLMGFVAGALVTILATWAVARNVMRREEAIVRLLSSLQAGFTEAAASGVWPLTLEPLPPSEAGSGELVVWDLLGSDPVPVTRTPGADLDLHQRLLQAALDVDRDLVIRRVRTAAGRRLNGLAVLVRQQGELAIVNTFCRERPFSERELNWATALGRLMGNSVEIVLAQRRSTVLADLVDSIDAADDAREVIELVTRTLSREMGGMASVLLRYERGRFMPYAMAGDVTDELRSFLSDGMAPDTGLAWEAYRRGGAIYLEQYGRHPRAAPELVALGIGPVAIVPLEPGPGSRTILALAGLDPRRWRAHDRELIERVRQILRVVLDLRYTEERLDAVVKLERELVVTEAGDMPGRLLEAAVSMVPGADGGSLLLRDGDVFRFVALYGTARRASVHASLSERDALRWYASDRSSFQRGEPRLAVAAGADTLFDTFGGRPVAEFVHEEGWPVANLNLPVVDEGDVIALLNLDSLHDRHAFGPDSLEVLRAFQPLIAFVLRDAERRQRLTANATTDALTGLPNRRAFDDQVARALAAAERYGTTLALLVMDMRGFKAINDTYGHRKGDEVLKQVAAALATVPRAGDIVYRWGGDEFAALLRNVDTEEAVRVGERFAEQVRGVEVLDMPLGINVGVALYPTDARDLTLLLELADARMYLAKDAELPVVATDGPAERDPEAEAPDGPSA